MAYQLSDFAGFDLSVAMTADQDRLLDTHVHKPNRQEDLAFAYWRPSRGARRFTAVICELVMPEDGDRVLQGNVAFLAQFLHRVLAGIPDGCGVAFLHGHPAPGWQGMSDDDIVAERGPVGGSGCWTNRPPASRTDSGHRRGVERAAVAAAGPPRLHAPLGALGARRGAPAEDHVSPR